MALPSFEYLLFLLSPRVRPAVGCGEVTKYLGEVMRSIALGWRAMACLVVMVAAVGCGSSGTQPSVPTTTDPDAPKIERISKDSPGEGSAARTPEAEPLGVD